MLIINPEKRISPYSISEAVQWTTADAIPSGDNMGSAVFRGIAAGAKLRIPTGTTALYEAADQWKDFVIEEYTPTPTALPNVNGNANVNGKFLRNGQLIIVKDNKMFNAQGMKL